MIYGVLRFFIEIERTDALMIAGFKMAQIVSVIMFIIGLVLMMYISRKPKFDDLYNDRTNVDEIRF
jgi:prolipoprotein diacylglyceryltransferase